MPSIVNLCKTYLFLQGPHGPFMGMLGDRLAAAGHRVLRINFNGGDKIDWQRGGAEDFYGTAEEWPAYLRWFIARQGVTDIVFYGSWRPVHHAAIGIARDMGVMLHGFEEGLLRPHWVTLSPLMPCEQAASLKEDVQARKPHEPMPEAEREIRHDVPSYTGAHNWMLWRCFVYYAGYLMFWPLFRRYNTHRLMSPASEFVKWFWQLACYPRFKFRSWQRLKRLNASQDKFFLLCLQLDGDSQIQRYSSHKGMEMVMNDVMASFAAYAPEGVRLVIKAHPLDNNMANLACACRRLAKRFGIWGRVDFIYFGKLAGLMKRTEGLVTVNSSTGISALYHGCPLKTLGLAAYNLEGLVDDQPLDQFWRNPQAPSGVVYDAMFDVLTRTTQFPGGFYRYDSAKATVPAVLPVLLGRRRKRGMQKQAASPVLAAAQQR